MTKQGLKEENKIHRLFTVMIRKYNTKQQQQQAIGLTMHEVYSQCHCYAERWDVRFDNLMLTNFQ